MSGIIRDIGDASDPTEAIVLHLPMPPSSNSIWRSVVIAGKQRTILSKPYRDWKEECDAIVMGMRPRPRKVDGHFRAHIRLNEDKRRRNADCDNRGKAPLDFLQRAGLIDNDCLLDGLTIEWGPAKADCVVTVWPTRPA